MPALALLLLVISAGLHTAWNLLLKGVEDKYLTTWWVVAVGAVISAVGLVVAGLPPRALLPYVAVSVLAEVLYFLALTRAYSGHEFSLVYPIGRGAAPGLVAVWSYLFLWERPSAAGLAGLLLTVAGLLVIGAQGLRHGRFDLKGLAAGLSVALLISVYTLVDGMAVRRGPVVPYALAVFALMPFPPFPFVMRRYGWDAARRAISSHPGRIVLISALGIGSYLLALAAYRIAPLQYAAAVREVSVVMGAFAGWRLLGEQMGAMRLMGALVVLAGITLISLSG